jgi:DNA adenine methylase
MRNHKFINWETNVTEPILRWAGSKKKLLPILKSAAPESFSRYIEPFVGSAVLYLQLPRTPAILGDLNEDLITTYASLREHPRAVWNRLSKMPTDDNFYYELRAKSAESMGEIDRAARFIYLNRFCFNGVYRTNRLGEFNVARGVGALRIPDWPVVRDFAASMQDVRLCAGDFEKVLARTKRGDFIYLDPPYALDGKRDRGEYGMGSFKEGDLNRLAEAMIAADKCGASVLLSYSKHPKLLAKLRGWHVTHLSVFRNVAGFASGRRKADEILVSNYSWSIS